MTAVDLKSCFCGCLPLKKGCIGISIFSIIQVLIYLGIQINAMVRSRIDLWPAEALVLVSLDIAFIGLNLCAAVALLIAATKEMPKVLQVWLIYNAVNLIFIKIKIYNNLQYIIYLIPGIMIWMCVDTIMMILFWYFMAVVYSFRKTLVAEQNTTMEMDDPSAKPMVG